MKPIVLRSVGSLVLAGTGSHEISKSALLYIPLAVDVCAPCRELQNRHTNDDFACVAGGSEKGLRPFDALRLSRPIILNLEEHYG